MTRRFGCKTIFIGAALLLGMGPMCRQGQAQTYNVLHTFTGGADGYYPSGLIQDALGNLYGTTYGGGDNSHNPNGAGVVFKLTPPSNGSLPWTETVLYTFTGGADGDQPYFVGVIQDALGNLYGTTELGGDLNVNNGNGNPPGAGVVFKLDPSGNETVLHSFTDGADGGYPLAGLIMDKKHNLYGTTYNDGGAYNAGVVFKLTPPVPPSTTWTETVLHTFSGGADGVGPLAGLIMDKKHNLYGTTRYGGANGAGVVFKLDKKGHETVLYTFTGGADGAEPYASSLIQDKKGNLYGTTAYGGLLSVINPGNPNGAGVVFKLDKKGHETVLYTFTGGADGAEPYAGVIRDAQGNLYGTTNYGGNTSIFSHGAGVVFKLAPPYGPNSETVLYTFTGGADGGYPLAGLIMDKQSNLYGTTQIGGSGQGVAFKIIPSTLKSLKVNPKAVKVGHSAMGAVALTLAAPSGGAVVSLSSSDPTAASVPASVTVPAGSKKASFMIMTSTVSSTTTVTISATYGGTTKTATLTIKP